MARPVFVFAHGAGAPSSSPWMKRYARLLSELGPVVPFDYPYMKQGRRSPNPLPKLIEAHAEAVARARAKHDGPVVLIGKSMGSRVGCHLALREKVKALVCLGYPLKGMGTAGKIRDEVLLELETPILFVQGTRDNLCPLDLLEDVAGRMRAKHAIYVVDGGNHSLEVTKTRLKETASTQAEVERAIVERIRDFVA